jgi:hypothetical protein
MTLKSALLAVVFLSTASCALAGDPISVGFRDVVSPAPALRAVVRDIVNASISARPFDARDYDRFFAPSVRTFMKSDTPLQPFEARDDITENYLENAGFVLHEKRDGAMDADLPRLAQAALSEIVSQIAGEAVWGTLPEVPGMVCASAVFDLDRQAVAKFSRMFAARLDKLVLSRKALDLHDGQASGSPVIATVPPFTLMAIGRHDVATDAFHPVTISTTLKGFILGTPDLETLAQKHVCFAQVDGRYRIAALFGYGL